MSKKYQNEKYQKRKNGKKEFRLDLLLLAVGSILLVIYFIVVLVNYVQERKSQQTIMEVREFKELVLDTDSKTEPIQGDEQVGTESEKSRADAIKISYNRLFDLNEDMIGWLTIPDTDIDYPVMQTMEDEEYYLYRDFYGNQDKSGCLLLDTDSDISAESNNLIIHGHSMHNGTMFGKLTDYGDSEYGREHNKIYFYTRDGESREYEVLAVFYSQIYGVNQDVFKYYQFFEAQTQQEFDDFYYNIMKLKLYDTGVEAEYGDELITLSTCAYHTDNGRFVVVGKRVN